MFQNLALFLVFYWGAVIFFCALYQRTNASRGLFMLSIAPFIIGPFIPWMLWIEPRYGLVHSSVVWAGYILGYWRAAYKWHKILLSRPSWSIQR